jgi:predicted amidohydrolase
VHLIFQQIFKSIPILVNLIGVTNMCPYQNIVGIAVVNFKSEADGLKPDKVATLKKIGLFTMEAAKQGANIIVFPELALTSYSGFPTGMAYQLSEPIPGPSTKTVQKIASKHSVYVAFGMIERDGSKLYNAVPFIGPTGVLGVYRKVHPAKFAESWVTPGDSYPLIQTPWGPIGIGICYDNYCFPEVPRIYALRGARIHLNVTAFPQFPDAKDYWDFYITTLGARSIENNMFIASANMVGKQGEFNYFGHSMIIGPKSGKISYHIYAGPLGSEEGIAMATLDLSLLKNLCMGVRTIFKDRRPETYTPLIKVTPTNNVEEAFRTL